MGAWPELVTLAHEGAAWRLRLCRDPRSAQLGLTFDAPGAPSSTVLFAAVLPAGAFTHVAVVLDADEQAAELCARGRATLLLNGEAADTVLDPEATGGNGGGGGSSSLASAPLGPRSCAACTFLNEDPGTTACAMCGTALPPPVDASKGLAGALLSLMPRVGGAGLDLAGCGGEVGRQGFAGFVKAVRVWGCARSDKAVENYMHFQHLPGGGGSKEARVFQVRAGADRYLRVSLPLESAAGLEDDQAGCPASSGVGLRWAAPGSDEVFGLSESMAQKVAAEAAAAAKDDGMMLETPPTLALDTAPLKSPLRLHTLTEAAADLAAVFGPLEGFDAFSAALFQVPAGFDEELVAVVDAACSAKPGLDPAGLSASDLMPHVSAAFPRVRAAAPETLRLHLSTLKHFNKMVAKAVPLVDLRGADKAGSLAHSLVRSAPLLWLKLKADLWEKALTATRTPGDSAGIDIRINRIIAADQRSRRSGKDAVLLNTTFGQIFSAVNGAEPRRLRISGGEGRVWRANFVGEGSIDAGGPYRESLSDATNDVHLPHLGLFLPCANHKSGLSGDVDGMGGIHNMDKYVPNPSRRKPLHVQMYVFVGKLMGIAMRTKASLPFHFPPLFYKKILGHPVGRLDLKAIDKFLVDKLDDLCAAPEKPGMTAEIFDDQYGDVTFMTTSADGRPVELAPGGKKRHLDLSNCAEYVRLMYGYHLSEFDAAAAAVARGLATQVPLTALRLFTAPQLELLVTGRTEVDLELLKQQTEYQSPYTADHPVVRMFWEMMEGFTHLERSAFIKFVWSRDRLPLRGEDFTSRFKITALSVRGPANGSFPKAHTCFFTVDLPQYTTLEAMTEKVRYAIENCQAIDTDGGGGNFEVPGGAAASGESDDEDSGGGGSDDDGSSSEGGDC